MTTFAVEIYTPEREVFRGDVDLVTTKTEVGSIGIKAGHVPLLARLRPTLLRLHSPEGEVTEYAQGEGWLEMFGDEAIILCEEAVPPAELDATELRRKLEEAEKRLEAAGDDTAEAALAERARVRAEAFLEVAGQG